MKITTIIVHVCSGSVNSPEERSINFFNFMNFPHVVYTYTVTRPVSGQDQFPDRTSFRTGPVSGCFKCTLYLDVFGDFSIRITCAALVS